MNSLERALHRSHKSIREACVEAGIAFEDAYVLNVDQCNHCGIWMKIKELKPDLDKNPICATCYEFEGA